MAGVHLELVRDAARTFPEVHDPASFRSATMWHCKYKSLEPLGALRNLEQLVIATFPDASFDVLGKLGRLRFLRIVHMPNIRELAALGELTQLETLSLSTLPSWDASGKTTIIDSLAPLASLPRLTHLELLGVVPPDRSLAALEKCQVLRTARLSQYPRAETSRFFGATGIVDGFFPDPSFL